MLYTLVMAALLGQTPTSNSDFYLTDGSVIYGKLVQEYVILDTKYGQLKINADEVYKIDFAWRTGDEEIIRTCMKNLNSQNFKERELATNKLEAFGFKAYPFLMKFETDELEVKNRVKEIVANITKSEFFDKNKTYPEEDVVFVADNVFSGKIKSKFHVKSETLGELSLDLHNYASYFALKNVKFNISAEKMGIWKDVGVKVNQGQIVQVKAKGQIDLWAQAPGTHPATPNGSLVHIGKDSSYKAGALLGKVGNQVFLIGDECEITGKSGNLQIQINPANWAGFNGVDGTGSYDLGIRVVNRK